MTLKFISRLRSRREVQDQLGVSEQAAVGDGGGSGGECCCWNKLPPELLREVLLKIEDSETCWPQRKTVVACAGVCKSWRLIIKEIVQIPEFSRKLTFPISVKQPGPNDGLLHCFIKRNRSTRTYCLYLGLTNGLTDDGKFLLAARKCRRPTCTDYIISLQAEDMLKGSCAYVGKLRSNYIGNRFTILDGQSPHTSSKMAKNDSSRSQHSKQASSKVPFSYYPMAHISYELDVFGSRGPRRMQCIMETIPAKGAAQTRSECSRHDMDVFQSNPIIDVKPDRMCNFRSGSLSGQKNDGLVLINKAPRWHEQLHCWCLNFHGRVTVASVKNFQLVASPENEKIILQFGKVGKDIFTMDYQYPISAFQAFSICLSSFDTKIACE